MSVVKDNNNDGELMVVTNEVTKPSEDWIIDTICTFHMSPNKDWFSSYKTLTSGDVLMGNKSSCKINDIGIVKIKRFDGIVQILTNVRHVLDLKRNFISLSTLDLNRYKFIGEGKVIKVSKGALVVMKGKMEYGQLYVL